MADNAFSRDFDRLQREIRNVSSRLGKAQKDIERGIKSELAPAVRTLGSSLTEVKSVMTQIGGALAKVGEINREGFQMVNASVKDVVQSAGETEILIRSSNIKAMRAQVEILEKSIGELKERFGASLGALREQYAKLLEGVIERRENRLGELDSHIIDLVESEFIPDVEKRLTRFSAFDQIAKLHIADVWDARGGILDQDLSGELRSIEEFTKSQSNYDEAFRSVIGDGDTTEEVLGIPFAVLECSNTVGQRRVLLAGPVLKNAGTGVTLEHGGFAETSDKLTSATRGETSLLDVANIVREVSPATADRVRAILDRWHTDGQISRDVHESTTHHLQEGPRMEFRTCEEANDV